MTHVASIHVASALILGGARSGKSRFAEQIACESGLDKVYVATALAGDEEMRERIAHHRQRRGAGWRTVEEPRLLSETISREGGEGRIVLVDCLTLWLSNVMHANDDTAREADRLIDALQSSVCPVILV